MCLDSINKTIRKPGIGYKILKETNGENGAILLKPICRPLYQQDSDILLKFGKWNIDPVGKDFRILTTTGGRYPTGFHVFREMESALTFYIIYGYQECPLYKIEYRDVVASGYQDDEMIDVARKIKPISKVASGLDELYEALKSRK